jgi:hypothetical protein
VTLSHPNPSANLVSVVREGMEIVPRHGFFCCAKKPREDVLLVAFYMVEVVVYGKSLINFLLLTNYNKSSFHFMVGGRKTHDGCMDASLFVIDKLRSWLNAQEWC